MQKKQIIAEFRESITAHVDKEMPDEEWWKQAYEIFVLARDREIFWTRIRKIHDDLRRMPR